MKKTETTGVYALGLRCNVWMLLPPTPDVRSAASKDAKILINSIIRQDREGRGFYHANWGANALQLYHITRDRSFVERIYPGLSRYGEYFERERDRETDVRSTPNVSNR